MDLLVLLGVALFLGMRHSLDPDHLVAVSTLVSEEKRLWPAAWLGFIWGVGHIIPIALVGLPILIFQLEMAPQFEDIVDAGVGFLLVYLGVVTLWRVFKERVHFDVHSHNETVHGHFHRPGHSHPSEKLERRQWITFGFGLVHGLAGSGAVAVLAMQASVSLEMAMLWLLIFGLGTILGMFAMTLFIAAPALTVASKRVAVHASIRTFAGLASLCFGGFMLWTILPELLG
ncbi:ABC-type nickel/cobalt efflux system permease component RcnA [Caldalkalibacillus uzonensis]|uniref:Nickel/cobalt efflux system n=1 Tax=Caldalkalibacillus uzonensis TaxID=353224 RepID=A0ABU0CXR9_9BACI|nr:sulfite exporter TauE/SafE family protein [Caldalkalibacillus uzonensis]MDQ0340937.1 ABC-type nickel/cobalt efflux system permease component RcnA [Caldalkalibacillus uzonensis]